MTKKILIPEMTGATKKKPSAKAQPITAEVIVEPKVFNTIYDVVTDPKFTELLEKNIGDIKKQRRTRPEAKPGFYYKRDWFDKLQDMDAINPEFFLKNITDIWTKKSNLNSQTRSVISQICEMTLRDTLMFYNPPKTDTDEKG